MTIDISKIRPGDTVTVKATVVHVDCGSAMAKVRPPDFIIGGEQWTNANNIVSHTPKSIAVGEMVREQVSGLRGRLEATCGLYGWLIPTDPARRPFTAPLSNLERADV